jgi:hypothetical protein
MESKLQKFFKEQEALEVERRLLSDALARLGPCVTSTSSGGSGGRLAIGLDLTASREEGLHDARIATAAMFDSVKAIGLLLKLLYYRGKDEFEESKWCRDPDDLKRFMLTLSCKGGSTQIARLLSAVLNEREKVSGVVFIGDDCEEDASGLVAIAKDLGRKHTPVYIFHECQKLYGEPLKVNQLAKPIFERIAQSSGGVYVEFTPESADVLRELLSNVAAYSTAGAEGIRQLDVPKTAAARHLQERLLLSSGETGSVTLTKGDGTRCL